jgi:hypothetical protein
MNGLPSGNQRVENSRGKEVANRDLLDKASSLEEILKKSGRVEVEHVWIPREQN